MFCHQTPLKININIDVKKQTKENLINAFNGNPLTDNAHKNVLPTQINTASKSCRFISLWENSQWATCLTGITVRKN